MEKFKKIISPNILNILFGIILLISGVIRIFQSLNFDFPFTFDQARDMLDIRVIGNFIDFKVSGPTTSITGLNLGPYYYFLNLPAYWIGFGNPQFLIYWNILLFLLSAVAIYLFFFKRNQLLGFYIASIFLMSPQLFSITRYFWNAHAVVYIIVLYFLAFWKFIENKNAKNALIWGVAAGLLIQFEAAFGSMCLVFAFLFILLNRDWKMIRNFLLGSLPWFLPQVGYEVINHFQMTKLLSGIFTGANPILGEKIALLDVMILHFKTITSFFEGQFMLLYGVGFAVLILAIFFALTNRKYKTTTLYFLSFLLFAYLYYVVIYHHELKPWYLEGIRVWYCFVIGIGFVSIAKFKKAATLLITLFLIRSFYLTILDQQVYTSDNGKSNDPKNAANILTSIDWVYGSANGEGFDAYDYVPEITDFSTQYMYSWYGSKTYGYIPEKVSYSVSPVPEYIRSNDHFQDHRKPTNGKVALMYETVGDYESWLGQFKDYCVIDQKEFDFRVKVEWREKCDIEK
jgi:hypothetical protein